ncbi:hypothetical protein HDU87_002216 [Geranomyces variabilis]|uniref:Endonuclease/exonuclease/phosphatase domain-containing protein n=1 Tax=Geranomyces variabilis TaxID=109894 RepID=A0AAD5TCA0_9FUNG|nr:hypothetical protein HDU87_002216 [Geranomyces variabilis]
MALGPSGLKLLPWRGFGCDWKLKELASQQALIFSCITVTHIAFLSFLRTIYNEYRARVGAPDIAGFVELTRKNCGALDDAVIQNTVYGVSDVAASLGMAGPYAVFLAPTGSTAMRFEEWGAIVVGGGYTINERGHVCPVAGLNRETTKFPSSQPRRRLQASATDPSRRQTDYYFAFSSSPRASLDYRCVLYVNAVAPGGRTVNYGIAHNRYNTKKNQGMEGSVFMQRMPQIISVGGLDIVGGDFNKRAVGSNTGQADRPRRPRTGINKDIFPAANPLFFGEQVQDKANTPMAGIKSATEGTTKSKALYDYFITSERVTAVTAQNGWLAMYSWLRAMARQTRRLSLPII